MWHGACVELAWIWYIMLRCHVLCLSRYVQCLRITRHHYAYLIDDRSSYCQMDSIPPWKRNIYKPSLPVQKKRFTTAAAPAMAKSESWDEGYDLEELSKGFGTNPGFNRLMYSDDNVLMTLHIQLQNAKYKNNIDVSMDGTNAVCTYDVEVSGNKKIHGTVTASSKKAAKKEAARRILSQLTIPTTEEYEDITKWIVSGHRRAIQAREEPVSKTFGPIGHLVRTRWTIGDKSFEGRGVSNSLKMAELYALQDLYCQTHHLGAQQSIKDIATASAISTQAATITNKETVLENELSKGDASQMNTMRSKMANKMRVNQQEDITPVSGGFECTLIWTWTDSSGITQQKIVNKCGTSKALAKAAASKAMMVEMGVIDPVSPQESAQATHIRNIMRTDIERAVQLAADFMKQANCTVWRLFLPQLMENIVQMCDARLAAPIIDALNATDAKVPSDIWETLLSLSSISIDEKFCRKLLNSMKNLSLESRYFISSQAMEYYKHNSWLISLEFNAEICSSIASIQERDGRDVPGIVCNLLKAQLPLLFFSGNLSGTYMKNPLKEEDMVLVVPYDGRYQWEQGLLCVLSKSKTEDNIVSITCKVINKMKWDTPDSVFASGQFAIFNTTNTTTNRRMLLALQGITHKTHPINSPSHCYKYNADLRKVILEGSESSLTDNKRDNVVIRTNIPLTDAQNEACKSAMVNTVTLIQGPPGTGKTQVACAIIDCWRRASDEKILAVADSNVAADNLIEALDKRGLTALRVGFGSESLLQEEVLKDLPRYERYRALRAAGMHKEANSVWTLMIGEAVKKHQIIIATCIGSGNDILTAYSFPFVVIDECAQSVEASNLIPIGRDCKQLVLIGDHKQLRPTIISMDAARKGLSISLLERLASHENIPVHLLDVQRRMHPSISEFPNHQFYDGRIKDDVPVETRMPIKGFRWPNGGYNVAFIDASSGHPNSQFETAVGTSKSNQLELEIVMILLKSFLKAGDVKESQIGVLTPYDAQKWSLRRLIQESLGTCASLIDVDSVDGFQGKEKELILFSAVRSNLQKDIGFLRDPRRMNVMLTRARRGLIIIADRYTIMNDHEHWKPYVDYVLERGLNIHFSELNTFLETPSMEIDHIVRRLGKGAYEKYNPYHEK